MAAILVMQLVTVRADSGDGEKVWPDPQYTVGRPATLEEAKVYWTGSALATTVTMVTLLFLVTKYRFDPVFSDPSMLVFFPILLGNLLFTAAYGTHHVYNLINGETHYYDGEGGIMNSGFWCDVTWLAPIGLNLQWAGLAFVAWVPLHIIQSAKKFKPIQVTYKRLACIVAVGIFVGLFAIVFLYSFNGRAQYRRLYCSGKMWGHYPSYFMIVLLTCGTLSFAVYCYCRAHVELRQLARDAHVPSLLREAAVIKKYGIITLLNCLFWNTPQLLLLTCELFGIVKTAPIPFVLFAGWGIKYNALGDFFIIWFHSRGLRKKLKDTGVEVAASFSEQPGTSDEVGDTLNLRRRGISYHFLQWFFQEFEIDDKLTIQEVMMKVVMEATMSSKCCYVDAIKGFRDDEGRPAVGPPQYFVSHCWADTFANLVEQLTSFYRRTHRNSKGTVYFWIDIFAINQHNVGAPTELAVMPSVVETVDAVVLTLNPWTAPKTLTRVWCLWEVLKALQFGTKVVPVMPASEEEDFMATIHVDAASITKALNTIDAQNANATNPADKHKIFQEISESIGFGTMNDILKSSLRLCLQGIAVDRSVSMARATSTAKKASQAKVGLEDSSQGLVFIPMEQKAITEWV